MTLADDWIASACLDLGKIPVDRLDPEEAGGFVDEVVSRYGRWRTYGGLAHRLHARCSFHDPDAWKSIAEYDHGGPAFLFSDRSMGRGVYRFESIKLISDVLGECPDFDWYVVDEGFSFLLAGIDDDVLVGAGKASSWVARRARSAGKRAWIFVAGV